MIGRLSGVSYPFGVSIRFTLASGGAHELTPDEGTRLIEALRKPPFPGQWTARRLIDALDRGVQGGSGALQLTHEEEQALSEILYGLRVAERGLPRGLEELRSSLAPPSNDSELTST